MSLLSAQNIHCRFGGIAAVDGAWLEVEAGTITGLIGPNGAGKTTLFNAISGLVAPHAGRLVFAGEDITSWSAARRSRAGLVRSFQIARGLSRLSVLENLMLYGRPQPGEGLFRAVFARGSIRPSESALVQQAEAIAGKLALERVLNHAADKISGGQKKLLEIGRVLMARPKLALFDEPIAGVNPALAKEIAEAILHLRDEGLTILVIEHNMDLIAAVCDTVIVMAEGRVLAKGGFAEVAAIRAVQDAYMGARRRVA